MDFTFRQVRYFLAAAETGQISKAAMRCHITQSSMTTALQQLEEAVDATLFVRNTRGLRLTDAGERFLRHAQQIQNIVRAAGEDMRTVPAGVTGTLRLGVTDTISAYLIPTVVLAFQRRFPDLNLQLVEGERETIEAGVRNRTLDLGLLLVSNLRGDVRDDGFGTETLLRSPRRLWLSPAHPLAAKEDVSLADLLEQPYLLLDMDEHIPTTRAYWAALSLEPNVHFQTKSIEAIRSLVAQGSGVTILSDLLYRPWSLDGARIVRRVVREPVPTMDAGLIWLDDDLGPERLAPFRELLRALFLEERDA